MIILSLFIIFLLYAFSIFAINNFLVQTFFLLINIILMIIFKISIKKSIKNIIFLTPFIIVTAIFNFIFGKPLDAILVAFKLIIVCNITFIFKTSFGTTRIIQAIEMLFTPFKLFGINPSDISLIINIAIVFIPSIIDEINEIKYSLRSKACKTYSFSGIKYISKLLLISIFKRTHNMELALKAKGFSE